MGFNPIFISNRVDGTKLFKSKSVPVSANRSKPKSSSSSIKKHVNILNIAKSIPPPPHLQSNTHSHDSSETSEESFSETPPASAIDISIERTPEITDQSAIYLLLTQQRDEAILQNEKMENAAHEKEVAFTFKLSAFKKQLKQYKHTNNKLMKENISLKDEITKLKSMLSLFDSQNNLEMLLRKKKNAIAH